MLAKRVFYPAVMALTFLGYWAMRQFGVPLTLSAYVTVALFGPLVLFGERLIPFRREWRPSPREILLDGAYMGVVQVVLPLALVLLVQAALRHAGWTIAIWPSHWPIWSQVLLKIAIGDLLRYWLHRASHTWTPLWRLHSVHHAPEKLYTTNVFRFHPAEKALQFLGDTLPFIVIGVGPEVLSAYFVFYAMSGLFQHSNCDLRLGWLNYLVSGPEVHRWHHSQKIEESNANYAHSFVGWDLLFGTYFRPRGRMVTDLGLLERDYPQGFGGQMAAPFRRARQVTTTASDAR